MSNSSSSLSDWSPMEASDRWKDMRPSAAARKRKRKAADSRSAERPSGGQPAAGMQNCTRLVGRSSLITIALLLASCLAANSQQPATRIPPDNNSSSDSSATDNNDKQTIWLAEGSARGALNGDAPQGDSRPVEEQSDLQAATRYRRSFQPESAASKQLDSTRVVAVSGRSVELQCPLASELQALGPSAGHSISWRKNGAQLNQLNPRLKLNALNGSLLIVGAQSRLDEALYECELSAAGEQRAGAGGKAHRFDLRLVVPPRLAPFEFPQDAQVGMKLVLTCSVLEGQQPLSFVWLKDNQIIRAHQAGLADANSLVQLHQQQLADKQAPAGAQQTGHEYVILGAGFEPADEPPQAAPDQDKATNEQQADKQKHLLPSLSDSSIRVRQAEDYSILSLDKLELRHSGRYTCSVQNEAARVSHSAQLSINAPASLTVEPHDLDLVSGQSSWIDCVASGQPRPAISWLRARESANKLWDYVPVYDNLRYSTLANGTLGVTNVTQREQGYYLCSAKNGFGPEVSKLIKISVHEPARFSAKYRTVEVRIDERANMICLASGELPLSIEWLDKEARPIQRDDKRFIIDNDPQDFKSQESLANQTVSRLILVRTTRADSGHYTCLASNKHGSDKMITNLLVQDVPDKVTDLKVTNTTASTISIRWQLAFTGNSPVTSYLVQYQSDDPLDDLLLSSRPAAVAGQQPTETAGKTEPQVGAADQQALKEALSADEEAIDRTLVELTVEQATTSLVVRELNPYCLYRLRLAAINKLGLGEFSDWIRAKTEEAPPSGVPLKINAVATGPNSVKLQWSPPERRAWNGQLLGFNIGYRPLAEPGALELNKTVEWAPPTLQSLLASTGEGLYGQMNASSPLNQTGQANQKLRQHLRQLLLLQKQELVAHLTNLQRSASYLVWIQSVNGRGFGPQSQPIAVKTLDDVPPSAPSMRVQSSGPNSITIAWSMAGNFISPANQYSLFYRRVAQHPASIGSSRNASSTQPEPLSQLLLPPAGQFLTNQEPGPFIERTLTSQQLMVGTGGLFAGDHHQDHHKPFMQQSSGQQYQQFVYTLDQLDCGSVYELYMTTRNSVGKSEPSTVLTARTLGEPPVAPSSRNNLFARIGVHEIALNLLAWSTGGCPIAHITLRYKQSGETEPDQLANSSWPITTSVPINLLSGLNSQLLASQSLQQQQPQLKAGELATGGPSTFTIRGLLPSTAYDLEIIAQNSAGLTAAQYEFMTASLNGSRTGYSRREGVFRLDQRGQPIEPVAPSHGGPHILEQQASFSGQTGVGHQWIPLLLVLVCFICLVVSSTFCYFRLLDTWKGGRLSLDGVGQRTARNRASRSHQSDSPPSSLGAPVDKAAMWPPMANGQAIGEQPQQQEAVHYCMRDPTTNNLLSGCQELWSGTLKNPSSFCQSVSMKEFGPARSEASTLRNSRLIYSGRTNNQVQQNYATTLGYNQMCSIYANACKQKQDAARNQLYCSDQIPNYTLDENQQQETSWTSYGTKHNTTAYAIPSHTVYAGQQVAYEDYRQVPQGVYDQLQNGGHLLLEQQQQQLVQPAPVQQQYAMVQQKDTCTYGRTEENNSDQLPQVTTGRLNCAGQSVIESSSGSSSGIDVTGCPLDYSSAMSAAGMSNGSST